MAADTMTLLTPEQFARIRTLHLWARHIVEGMNVGVHRSPYHGFSAEFLEFRPYQPGESARMIDWRKYAKSDETVVRLFEDETNLRAHLLLDTSGSMAFASPGFVSKHAYASVLCAAIAWILVRQRDAVGFGAFGEHARVLLSPKSTSVHLRAIINHLDVLRASGRASCGTALDTLAGHVRRRGMCVVVSDLLDEPAAIERGLRHLRFKRQDVLLLWVRDPMERNFSHSSLLRLRDLETGERVSLDPGIAAEQYTAGMAAHRARLEAVCRDLRVDLTEVGTDEPVEKALSTVLQKRRRLF